MGYYTNAGPQVGRLRYGDTPDAIGILKALNDDIPIGTATCAGVMTGGGALWKLSVYQAEKSGRRDVVELPGLYVVADRQFRRVQ